MFERALDVDHRNITLWLRYAETEMRNKQINHARNLWDRAVTILPRANQFWYKYTYMEEMLGNVAGQSALGEWEVSVCVLGRWSSLVKALVWSLERQLTADVIV